MNVNLYGTNLIIELEGGYFNINEKIREERVSNVLN